MSSNENDNGSSSVAGNDQDTINSGSAIVRTKSLTTRQRLIAMSRECSWDGMGSANVDDRPETIRQLSSTHDGDVRYEPTPLGYAVFRHIELEGEPAEFTMSGAAVRTVGVPVESPGADPGHQGQDASGQNASGQNASKQEVARLLAVLKREFKDRNEWFQREVEAHRKGLDIRRNGLEALRDELKARENLLERESEAYNNKVEARQASLDKEFEARKESLKQLGASFDDLEPSTRSNKRARIE